MLKEGQTSLFQSEMHAFFFFFTFFPHGLVHYEFILKTETVNHHFYSYVLWYLWEDVQQE